MWFSGLQGAGISPLAYGAISAVSLGCADFIARYTTRALGQSTALLSVFVVTLIVFFPSFRDSGFSSVGFGRNSAVLAFHGGIMTVGMLLLYRSLARGPINVVAPIVAAHPVFVILFAVAMGSRPSVMQWSMMFSILVGVSFVVLGVKQRNVQDHGQDQHYLRHSILIAVAASFSYALMVVSGQSASLEYGPIGVLWLGHAVAFVVLLGWMVSHSRPSIPSLSWFAVLIAQGMLNASGILFLFLGSQAAFPEITAVVSSEFSVVTIFLAWLFLRERMSILQFAGLMLVCFGTGALILEGDA